MTSDSVTDVPKGLLLTRTPIPLGFLACDFGQRSNKVRAMIPELTVEIDKTKETSKLLLVCWFREGKDGKNLLVLRFDTLGRESIPKIIDFFGCEKGFFNVDV